MSLLNHRPYRSIMERFGLSMGALVRHHDAHLAEALAKAKAAEESARGDDLLEQVGALRSKALSILLAAERSGDLKTALGGIREARACIELLAEMRQVLDRRPVLNVLLAPEWASIRAIILDVVRDDPARRRHVLDRLRALEPA